MGLCGDGRVETSGIGLGGDDVRKTEEKRGGGGEKDRGKREWNCCDDVLFSMTDYSLAVSSCFVFYGNENRGKDSKKWGLMGAAISSRICVCTSCHSVA